MQTLKSLLKSLIEYFLGHLVWLEPPSKLNEVEALINQLIPVAIKQPLLRIGGKADGGYLMPDDFKGTVAVISPGVSNEVSFDSEMAKLGKNIYMVDGSVAGPPISNPKFYFQKKFLDVFENENNIRLDSLSKSIKEKNIGDQILQMDIEGAEYRVLLDTSDETLKNFRIMVIEFHHLDRMYANFPLGIIRSTFQKLLRSHYLVHIHPNNICQPRVHKNIKIPPVMEFTFYRKDRAEIDINKKLVFPHPLDNDNLPHLPSLILPECWREISF
jgi:hypothetical protein